MKQQVIIVDDHKIFRKGLKMVINSFKEAEVAAEASNGKEFMEIIDNTKADIVFMDINMPELNGFEATEKAVESYPDLKIIAMTSSEDISSVNKMLFAGVEGYMIKNSDYEDIRDAIVKVASGKNYFSESILINLTRSNYNDFKKKKNILPCLSPRETEVLKLLCKGYSKNKIAKKLFISERTVEKHKQNLFEKTETKNAVNLVIYAFQNNLAKL